MWLIGSCRSWLPRSGRPVLRGAPAGTGPDDLAGPPGSPARERVPTPAGENRSGVLPGALTHSRLVGRPLARSPQRWTLRFHWTCPRRCRREQGSHGVRSSAVNGGLIQMALQGESPSSPPSGMPGRPSGARGAVCSWGTPRSSSSPFRPACSRRCSFSVGRTRLRLPDGGPSAWSWPQ